MPFVQPPFVTANSNSRLTFLVLLPLDLLLSHPLRPHSGQFLQHSDRDVFVPHNLSRRKPRRTRCELRRAQKGRPFDMQPAATGLLDKTRKIFALGTGRRVRRVAVTHSQSGVATRQTPPGQLDENFLHLRSFFCIALRSYHQNPFPCAALVFKNRLLGLSNFLGGKMGPFFTILIFSYPPFRLV